MNSKTKQNIIESYNFNIGVAIALIFKRKDLKHVRNHIKRELERIFKGETNEEFWCENWKHGLYFSDEELDYGTNLNRALYAIWGLMTIKIQIFMKNIF
jgi:hypothetical protein